MPRTAPALFLLVGFAAASLAAAPAAEGVKPKASDSAKPKAAPAAKAKVRKAKPPRKPDPTFTDAAAAGPDFLLQGEYAGTLPTDEGPKSFGAQIIARGNGKFHAVGYPGGLPGAGYNGGERIEADGALVDGAVVFHGDGDRSATLAGGQLSVKVGDQVLGALKKVDRKSPTLGATPPAGAVVLFDGTTAEHFVNGRIDEEKLLCEGVTSKRTFRDFRLHLEFRTPFMPFSLGQARGNSGLYVQGRYEIQILDSFGLEGMDNECGGIYKVSRPKVNMCLPPLAWQSYDIDFTAARFVDGKKVKNARITVMHNGVAIHEDLELPDATAGNILKETAEPGPMFLQNHSNPVRFRNFWILER